jgi:hypothetical protein
MKHRTAKPMGKIIPDNSLGRERMARRFARQFCRLGEVNGCSIDAEQAAKMTAKRPPALAQAQSAA